MKWRWYSTSFSFKTSLTFWIRPTSMLLLISSLHTYPFQHGNWLSVRKRVGSKMASFFLHSSCSTSTLESTRGGSVGILTYQSCQHYYTLEKPSPLEILNAFCHPRTYHVSYVYYAPALDSLIMLRLLAEQVAGWFQHLILVASCWMKAPWLPRVLNMVEDIPHWCQIVKDHIMDVLIGWVLKGLQLMHLTLWLLSGVLCRQGFSSPVHQVVVGSDLRVYSKGLPAVLERIGWLVCLRGYSKQCHFYKIRWFLVNLFRVGLDWHTIDIYHYSISAFLRPHHYHHHHHHHHKASNHHIISELMCHFYSYHPLHTCILIHGMLNVCCPC